MRIRLWRGASADLPVFRLNKGEYGDNHKYRFDTYGRLPENFEKWNAKHLGAGGAFGYSDNVADLVDAITALNNEGIAAPICETLFDECVEMGATVSY